MKIIEALKKVKDLEEKIIDLRTKVAQYCARMSFESDLYEDQGTQISTWLQMIHDYIELIERLKVSIMRTNLQTQVTICIDGHEITKSLYAWMLRRQGLAESERQSWAALTDKGLKEQKMTSNNTGESLEFKIVRHFDPVKRDKKIETFKSEPSIIDGRLEIINAITDIIE